MVQTRLCASWKRTRAAPSSANQAMCPMSAPAPVDGNSVSPTGITVSLRVRDQFGFTLMSVSFVKIKEEIIQITYRT